MYALVEDVRELLGNVSSDIYVCGYGHFGDGNLHLNIADGRSNRDDVRLHFFASWLACVGLFCALEWMQMCYVL